MMLSLALPAVAVLSTLIPAAVAQTHTNCDPRNQTGCPDMPALGGNHTFNFNETYYQDNWAALNQGDLNMNNPSLGATFTIAKSGDSPQINSKFYLFFGKISVIMKAAPGAGIVSTAILQSEDLDEIDWEFLGNKPDQMTNYYGKGNRTMAAPISRGKDFNISDPHSDYHNYTIDWTKERIQWWIDDKQVRELKYAEADVGINGTNYPQTPMNIRIGMWAAGDKSKNDEGVVQWAGAETDFSKGPFTMIVSQVYAEDYTSAKKYTWKNMDNSGSWDKVEVVQGESEQLKTAQQPHGVGNRFNALSKTAKIAIAASVAGVVLILISFITICCIKQRRAGRREFAAHQADLDKEAAELVNYRSQHMQNGRQPFHRASYMPSSYNRI